MLAYAPQGTLLRIAIGSALAIHGVIIGASLMAPSESPQEQGEVAFMSQGSARDAAGLMLGGRTPMSALQTGLSSIYRGPSKIETPEDARDVKSDEAAEAEANGYQDDAPDQDAFGAQDSAKTQESVDGKLKEAIAKFKSRGSLGTLSTTIGGGGGTSASLSAAPPRQTTAAPNLGSLSARSLGSVPQGGARSAQSASKRRGALGQLGFANQESRKALGATSNPSSYEAAKSGFDGATGIGEAGPVGGESGGGLGGGSGVGQPGGKSGPLDSKENTIKQCPPGRFIVGDECVMQAVGNRTPWDAIQKYAWLLYVGAAIAIIAGIALIATGVAAVWGGVLIALGIAMIVAALVIGNQIEDQYGQKDQANIIYDTGSKIKATGDGRVTSRAEMEQKLKNQGGANGNFGFDKP